MEKQKIIEQLIQIGYSLTTEKDYNKLMEGILAGAKDLTNSDGGTLYLLSDDQTQLDFMFVQTDSMNIKMGGTNGAIHWSPVKLIKDDNTLNKEQVAAICAIKSKLINISDVYNVEEYNFEGTKAFDKGTKYRSKSMLVVPMKNSKNEVIGVLQLINKLDSNNNTINFTKEDENLILSMSSQAAVSIENIRLVEDLQNLLNSFIKTIGTAISEKSKYTGGHINRVATLTSMIANAINDDVTVFKNETFSEDELKELNTAAWLHDIGKIVTPEHIVDKATKLETIYDRINSIALKFELLKKENEINFLKSLLNESDDDRIKYLKLQYQNSIMQLDKEFLFIKSCNTGGEFMDNDQIKIVLDISNHQVNINGKMQNLLSDDEIKNLSIEKGTLNDEERVTINNHVSVTYNMLKKLPFPKKLKNVPLIAGSHHKAVKIDKDGKHGGYSHEDIISTPMNLKDKILAVADVFEALTASDRPYKKANSLNQSIKILSSMVKDQILDKDIVKFLVNKELHLEYANKYLAKSQIDEIELDFTLI